MSADKFPEITGMALELAKNHARLIQAMQAGVRHDIENELPDLSPELQRHLKHLRVGINSAMCQVSALQWLMIDKGLCTHEEYFLRLNRLLQKEVEDYEERLTQRYGIKVTLGG